MGTGSVSVVHASDAEVMNERIAQVVDCIFGNGASVSAISGSPYRHLFGVGYRGRPLASEAPTGYPTGNPRLTATARRRALRVLKTAYAAEFEELMRLEIEYLEANPSEVKSG